MAQNEKEEYRSQVNLTPLQMLGSSPQLGFPQQVMGKSIWGPSVLQESGVPCLQRDVRFTCYLIVLFLFCLIKTAIL